MSNLNYFCHKIDTMIKVGDKVKFLNDVGGGTVTGFVSKNMVNVSDEDGFEVPYPISELVNVSAPELNERGKVSEPTSKKEHEVVEPKYIEQKGEIINGKNSPDFYFCLVPANPQNSVSGEIDLQGRLVSDRLIGQPVDHFGRHQRSFLRAEKNGDLAGRFVQLAGKKLLLDKLIKDAFPEDIVGQLLILRGKLGAGDNHFAERDLGSVHNGNHGVAVRVLGACRASSESKEPGREYCCSFQHVFPLRPPAQPARR